MFCSKCGNQVPDNAAVCPSCGNQMNAAPVVTAPVQQMPVYTVPVAPAPQNKNTGMVISIVIVSIIAVAAIVFAVLFATGTISINKDETTKVSENENGGKPVVKEPEIGSISDLPVVTGDKSVKKVMIKTKTFNIIGSDSGKVEWIAMDYTNQSEPGIYVEANINSNGTMVVGDYLYQGQWMYMMSNMEPDTTYKTPMQTGIEDMTSTFNMIMGRYEETLEKGVKFKYLGKENMSSTGSAYIYEYIVSGSSTVKKVWIDSDTGIMVKIEVDGEVHFEAYDIIIGDDVEFPNFDIKNAILT